MKIEVCDKCGSRHNLVDDLVHKRVICRKCLGPVGKIKISLVGGNLDDFGKQVKLLIVSEAR